MRRLVVPLVVLAVPALVGLGGCSSTSGDSGRVDVVASFYPLQFVAEQVGDGYVDVTNLTPPGAEPHDLELKPQDVAEVTSADLVVYLSGFQAALDDAVAQADPSHVLDVAASGDASLPAAEGGGVDPHFWLDPTRLADVADAVADKLGAVDPEHAGDYTANAAALRTELDALDAAYAKGLARCDSRSLVTSHEAFGYLAARYDLEQVGIAGLSPDVEPTAADLARVTTFVQENQVTTIFYETLVSPDVADTLARETGTTTAVLDPLEGLTDQSAGDDYLSVMQSNLATLRTGLGCR